MAPAQSNPTRVKIAPPHTPDLSQRALAWLIYWLAKTVGETIRWRFQDMSGRDTTAPLPQAIYCIWHNRLALSIQAYLKFARPNTESNGLAVMVSASRDGALLARVLERFGVQPIRGSTSRRGPQALLELVGWAERGFDLGITPDGPRGPCYEIQEGVIWLGQLTGLPIYPFSYDVGWAIRAGSWDRFIIPLPFSVCTIRLGKPLRIPRETTQEMVDHYRAVLKAEMMRLGRE